MPLGAALGHVVAVLHTGGDFWGVGIEQGIYGGSLCGLAAGLLPLLFRRWWARALVLTTGGAALGTYLASGFGPGMSLPAMGAAAGALHGIAMTALLAATRRLQMRRRRERLPLPSQTAEAANLGCNARLPTRNEIDVLARLRGRVHGAGRGVLVIRYLLPALAGAGVLGVAAGWPNGAIWLPAYLALGLLLGLPVSIPLACVYRRLRSRSFRRQLAVIPPAQRLEILAALDDPDLPGTREIVRPLLRDLSIGKEMAPAAVADGRGDEMTV
jgi:hypothetical protein